MNTAEWRVNEIQKVVENFIDHPEEGNLTDWCFFAMGEISSILELSDEEVQKRIKSKKYRDRHGHVWYWTGYSWETSDVVTTTVLRPALPTSGAPYEEVEG